MNLNPALIKYNIDYYIRSVRYLPPLLLFVAFLGINYQVAPIGIWSNLHITLIAIFILSSWVGVSFVNSEDKTQQYITRLHINNEITYHLSKIISIVVFLIPFYAITFLIPLLQGSFMRNLLLSEVFVYAIVYFLIGLLGIAIGVFFNSDIFFGEMAILAHLVVISVIVIPFNVIFNDNPLIVYAYTMLPPINFLAQRLHDLDDGVFIMDINFLIFVLYSLVYSLVLIGAYIFVIRKKSKQ